MTPFKPAFPVAVSLCLAAGVLDAARPHYGGTLRVATTDAGVMRRVNGLSNETLIGVDPAGGLRPVLATSWEADARGRRWTFHLRRNVKLHDGTLFQSPAAVAELRRMHPDWQVESGGDAVTVDPGRDAPDLPWELVEGPGIGAGPFRVERVDAGLIVLRAHDDYWAGRPFLDTIEVRTGRATADQLTSLEAARADFVPAQPTDVRRIEQRQLRIYESRPLELLAIVFEPQLATAANQPLRRAFDAAIDRVAIARVVLQGRAEPAGALLPQWISGYAPFVLARPGEPLSRSAVMALPAGRRNLALRVAPSDPAALAIAQRIAVSVRDAGFVLTVQAPSGLGPRFDMRLVRLPVRAATPSAALSDMMAGLGARTVTLAGRISAPEPSASLGDVLRVERALLEHDVIVPIVHIPELYAASPRVQTWNGPPVRPSGAWDFGNVWLSTP